MVALALTVTKYCDRRSECAPCARSDDEEHNRNIDYDRQKEAADKFGVTVDGMRCVRQRPIRNDLAHEGPTDRSVSPLVNFDDDGGGDS